MGHFEKSVESVIPSLEALQSLLHPLLVVLHHVRMHVQVVAADVSLRAAVGDGAKAKRGIMLLRFLELWGRHRK